MHLKCAYKDCQMRGDFLTRRFDEEWPTGPPYYCKAHAILVSHERHHCGGHAPRPVMGFTDIDHRKVEPCLD